MANPPPIDTLRVEPRLLGVLEIFERPNGEKYFVLEIGGDDRTDPLSRLSPVGDLLDTLRACDVLSDVDIAQLMPALPAQASLRKDRGRPRPYYFAGKP
jgi:hypothetical protein